MYIHVLHATGSFSAATCDCVSVRRVAQHEKQLTLMCIVRKTWSVHFRSRDGAAAAAAAAFNNDIVTVRRNFR